MPTISVMSFMLGALFLAISLFGGGIEVHELKIPQVGKIGRLLSCVVGAVFILLAIQIDPTQSSHADPAVNEQQTGEVESSETSEWLTQAEYRHELKGKIDNGYYLIKLDGRCEGGSEQFRAEYQPRPLNLKYTDFSFLTSEEFEKHNDDLTSKGYENSYKNKFIDCQGNNKYISIWTKQE